MQQTLGDRLKELRDQARLSQNELAVKSGVAANTIRDLEQNRRDDAQWTTLMKLCEAMKLTLDAFWIPNDGTKKKGKKRD
jgi:transcriptional regulator with XRE-family HTH domain